MKIIIDLPGVKGKYCGGCVFGNVNKTFKHHTYWCIEFILDRQCVPIRLEVENNNPIRCPACIDAEREYKELMK